MVQTAIVTEVIGSLKCYGINAWGVKKQNFIAVIDPTERFSWIGKDFLAEIDRRGTTRKAIDEVTGKTRPINSDKPFNQDIILPEFSERTI